MNLEARTLDDYLDEWLGGLSPAAKQELAVLVRGSGGDDSVLDRIPTNVSHDPRSNPRNPRKPPVGTGS